MLFIGLYRLTALFVAASCLWYGWLITQVSHLDNLVQTAWAWINSKQLKVHLYLSGRCSWTQNSCMFYPHACVGYSEETWSNWRPSVTDIMSTMGCIEPFFHKSFACSNYSKEKNRHCWNCALVGHEGQIQKCFILALTSATTTRRIPVKFFFPPLCAMLLKKKPFAKKKKPILAGINITFLLLPIVPEHFWQFIFNECSEKMIHFELSKSTQCYLKETVNIHHVEHPCQMFEFHYSTIFLKGLWNYWVSMISTKTFRVSLDLSVGIINW